MRKRIESAIAAGTAGFPTVRINGRDVVDLRLPEPTVIHTDQIATSYVAASKLVGGHARWCSVHGRFEHWSPAETEPSTCTGASGT